LGIEKGKGVTIEAFSAKGSEKMRPTPSEVDAIIFDMIAAEAAQVPDDTSLDHLWSGVEPDLRNWR
jgi:hypothetical protein